MTTNPERALPHNHDAERSVLGAVLVTHGRALDTVSDLLKASEFFRLAHQKLYAAMLQLYTRNEPIDFVTLKEQVQRMKALEDVGGPAYIASLTDGMPAAVNVAYYARIVRELATKREVIYLANKLLADAYEREATTAALVETAERGLLDISSHATPGDLVPASTLVQRIYPVIEALHEQRRPVTGLSTGFAQLDKYTRGLQPGNLDIIAARPSQGKSTLASQIALHASRTAPVAFFSVEMSEQEATFRALATIAGVDGHELQCGQLSMLDQQLVGEAMGDLSNRQFFLDESGGLTALQLRSRARRLKVRAGLSLIVVDYLQLLQHPKSESREQAVAATGRLLKQIARELNVPVLALCQLSRKVEERTDRKPQLSDLRESGSLEQDADVVLLLYRQPPSKKDNGIVTEIPPTELIVAKQRNGPTASIDLKWIREQYRFVELEAQS